MTTGRLSWGHPELDRVFQELPEFGAGLLVVPAASDRALVWSAMRQSLRASAEHGGLAVWVDELKPPHDGWSPPATRIDLALLAIEGPSDKLVERLATLPAAVVAVTESVPAGWERAFDLALTLADGQATQLGGDRKLTCSLATAPAPAAPPVAQQVRAGLRLQGVPVNLASALAALLPDAAFLSGEDKVALTIASGPWPSQDTSLTLRSAAQRGRTAYLAAGELRAADRAAIYAAGAEAVLPAQADAAELAAFVRANVPALRAADDKLARCDAEFTEQATTLRRNFSPKTDRDTRYVALLANRMARAALTGTRAAAVVARLPAAEGGTPPAAWIVDAVLRKGDMALAIGSAVVVVSPGLDELGARVVLRRLKSLVPGGKAVAAKLILAKPGAQGPEEAQRFWAQILAAAGP